MNCISLSFSSSGKQISIISAEISSHLYFLKDEDNFVIVLSFIVEKHFLASDLCSRHLSSILTLCPIYTLPLGKISL